MDNKDTAKVAVDTEIAREIPTVVVSQPKPSQPSPDHLGSSTSLPARLIKEATNLVMDFLETIVVALSIFVVVYLFLVQPHEVKGSSMEPNFHNNEYILTDKISYRFSEPKRGDVVIFKSPKNPEVDYIKRIIGLPSEQVKIQNGSVYINDKKLGEPYLEETTILYPGSFMQEGIEITIPANEYFVFGDNRSHSSDSREFGPISRNLIIGRAFMRYWPLPKFGLLPVIFY